MELTALGNLHRAAAVQRTRRSRSTTANAGSAASAGKGGNRSFKRGKFNAAGERVNGIWMASAAEAERYRQLMRMDMAGMIDNLRTQVSFDLVVNNQRITRYRADFCYDVIDERGQVVRSIIEDVKGMMTPEFKLKQKLFNALQPVPLTVIPSKGAKSIAAEWADRIPD